MTISDGSFNSGHSVWASLRRSFSRLPSVDCVTLKPRAAETLLWQNEIMWLLLGISPFTWKAPILLTAGGKRGLTFTMTCMKCIYLHLLEFGKHKKSVVIKRVDCRGRSKTRKCQIRKHAKMCVYEVLSWKVSRQNIKGAVWQFGKCTYLLFCRIWLA